MKLDITCVRSILLEFEELPLGVYTPCTFSRSVSMFGIDSVEYTLKKLHEAGYINAKITDPDTADLDFYGIFDMTFAGHEFLEKIRDNKVWAKTKSIADSIGSRSFDVITKIATSILTSLISANLGI